jgi:hypothetical protein
MIVLKLPPTKPKWSAEVSCTGISGQTYNADGCGAILQIEERDLFSVETPTGDIAQFKCPLCSVKTMFADYPEPSVLPPLEAWEGLNAPLVQNASVYESKDNEFNVIHLDHTGARLFYLVKSHNSGTKPQIQVMNVAFLERGQERYEEAKRLLDADAEKVFRDPKYPLNGLNVLFKVPYDWEIKDRLERRLQEKIDQTLATTFLDKTQNFF